MIDFNKPYLSGNESEYINDAVKSGKISGNGKYSKLCNSFFEEKYSIKKALVTTSCTDALEMSALLSDINEDDEVIVPSYTFVSSALAFIRERAKIVFADSCEDHPNIDPDLIENLITKKTKAIVVVHYAGVACDMDKIMSIATKYNLIVIEDAAQCITSKYKDKYLGSIGDFGTFSFHETKNIQCGEGGLLAINNINFIKRAEIIWEKGTNRSKFFRGEIDKYGWVDTGSSFLPSEITSAYLFAQLESIEFIQKKRLSIWNLYHSRLKNLDANNSIFIPEIPSYATNNAHMFYFITRSNNERNDLIKFLRQNGIHAVFHYSSLHSSEYYAKKHDGRELKNSDRFAERLLRLPLYIELELDQVDYICDKIIEFYK